jgi:predicted GTPase
MPIDLKALEKQRAMIDDIIRIASDPEAAKLLEQVFTSQKKEAKPRISESPRKEPTLFPTVVSEGERGAQIASVRKVISQRDTPFTVGEIGSDLRSAGIDIDNVAVGKVLRRLADKGEFRIARVGVGSNPNLYEKTEKFRAA